LGTNVALGGERGLNKIAQGDVRIFSLLLTKYYQNRYLRVRISGNRHFTCSNSKKFKNLFFWRPFCHFFENAVSHNSQSYQPILMILNSKQWIGFFFPFLKFEENRSKIAAVRVPQPKTAMMAAMTSSNLSFQNRRKTDLANL